MKHFLKILVLTAVVSCAPLAQAVPVAFYASLNGANEFPGNLSPGTGNAFVVFDTALHTMSVHVDFNGLLAGTTAAHIHCCTAVANTGTAGVATTTPTFTGFPGGVTGGTYDHLFDMTLASSYNPAFFNAHGGNTAQAEADFFACMFSEKTYLNVHTTAFPGGEIRGFLHLAPEPGSMALLGLGLAGLGFGRRKRAG